MKIAYVKGPMNTVGFYYVEICDAECVLDSDGDLSLKITHTGDTATGIHLADSLNKTHSLSKAPNAYRYFAFQDMGKRSGLCRVVTLLGNAQWLEPVPA